MRAVVLAVLIAIGGAAHAQDSAEAAPAPFRLPEIVLPDTVGGLTRESVVEALTAAFAQARPAWIAAHDAAVDRAVMETAAAVARSYQTEVSRLIGERDSYREQVNVVQLETAAKVAETYLPRIAGLQAELRACQASNALDTVQNVALGALFGFIADSLIETVTGGGGGGS